MINNKDGLDRINEQKNLDGDYQAKRGDKEVVEIKKDDSVNVLLTPRNVETMRLLKRLGFDLTIMVNRFLNNTRDYIDGTYPPAKNATCEKSKCQELNTFTKGESE